MKAVKLKAINFRYEGSSDKALDDVDFFMEYGELALLSGVSGSGKSTLMNIVCGIIPHVIKGELSGDIYIDGESAKGMGMNRICRKTGVVLQNADAQIIQETVESEIAFGCENLGMSVDDISASIDNVCDRMKLDKDARTRTLSGGQKQRLITASVLAMRQKILILDEPLANLDGRGAKLLMNSLLHLAGAGYAILVIEHRLDSVIEYVDRVWHIEDGRLYEVRDKQKYLMSRAVSIEDTVGGILGDGNVFSLKNVHYKASKKEILKGVDLDIPKGGRTLLMGENGSGKTTLTRLIARLIRPSDGEIIQYIDKRLGKRRAGKKWFGKVGVVYQNPNYQLFMPTVKKEIEFGAVSPEYAREIAERFCITHLFDRHPQSLSEGQKRLVTIASVAATRPEVLILDEPTVGQDYAGLKRLVGVLNDIHLSSGNTMISTTHDRRCIDALCDKTAVIEDGVVKKFGGKKIAEDFLDKNLRQ